MKKLFSLRKIVCLCLALIMTFSLFTVSAEPTVDGTADAEVETADEETSIETELEGYELVAESNGTKMYADLGTGLFKLLTDDGNIYNSISDSKTNDDITVGKNRVAYASQLIVDYAVIDGFSLGGLTDVANSGIGCIPTVEEIENGIRVEYEFAMIETVIPVEYVLVDGKLNASIITKDIKESKEYSILNINLLPGFSAGTAKDKGYIFVPDGSGALINFNSGKEFNEYNKRVYGEELALPSEEHHTEDLEEIRMPVFGICQPGKKAFLGNIIEGDGSAYISAMSGNDTFGQNVCSAKLSMRTTAEEKFKNANGSYIFYHRIGDAAYDLDKFTVQYTLLGADKSTYSDLAAVYRDYIINDMGVKKNDNLALINVDAYGALEVAANFMGFKYTKLAPMTSYEDLTKILDALKDGGVDSLSFRYIGWQTDGITNKKQLKKSKILGVLGGKSDWKELQSYVDENGISASYDADLLTYRKSAFNNSVSTAFNKKAIQCIFQRSTYTRSFTIDPYYLLLHDKISKNAESYLKSINKSVKNISLSTLTNTLYSNFKDDNPYHRCNFPELTAKILKSYKDAGYEISGDNANAYTFQYLSRIYNAPTSSSSYLLFDRDVMFYQMALKGVISLTSEPRQFEDRAGDEYLKAAEVGSALLFNGIYENATKIRRRREEYLYGADYELWKDAAIEQYKEYAPLYESVKGQTIVKNSEIASNVMRTVFENGVTVTVNYNHNDVKLGTGTIKARSYEFTKGGTAK